MKSDCPGYGKETPYQEFINHHSTIHFKQDKVLCPLKCNTTISKATAEKHLQNCPSNIYTCSCDGSTFLASGSVLMPPSSAPPMAAFGGQPQSYPPMGVPINFDGLSA
mmetsp:Transcript_38466/g.58550  ORF Transcript_38466/g.58550 Transcript_38466/m.58550 type:complete len:108 (-) Transcript_38466:341-664(-)|eukprot:CAMPEP_0170495214 /NCGR_PEP_ID=MMETSP0208-20121228/15081_1 /TAXON_ID=197538 /ORGANISM="Strombidium inclinatum, Strain S3" /LENGTH=107 /DNA_ID=CAMNT_0010771373 /DNA_START=336 /DNA_END=659 /DNA_ORIENTATION=+